MSSFANIQSFFTSDQVVLIIQGQPGDMDSTHLFNSLNTQVSDTGIFLKKDFFELSR